MWLKLPVKVRLFKVAAPWSDPENEPVNTPVEFPWKEPEKDPEPTPVNVPVEFPWNEPENEPEYPAVLSDARVFPTYWYAVIYRGVVILVTPLLLLNCKTT